MNIQEFDILNNLYKKKYTTQRNLANDTGFSLGKINKSLKLLITKNYLNEKIELTPFALSEIQRKKPRTAIILAAGFGIRTKPITKEEPTGLIEINSEPIIERQIKMLHDVGITNIIIVVGFMKEHYDYLIDKYNVKLVFNSEYSTKNNLHSLNKVIENVKNTYIIPCDLWLTKNPFSDIELYSWYSISTEFDENSSVRINRNSELVSIRKNEIGNKMFGISYILEDDSDYIKDKVIKYSTQKKYDKLFWEEVLLKNKKMILCPKIIKKNDILEIYSYSQVSEIEQTSIQINNDIIKIITNVLNCTEKDIKDVIDLKKGMTNKSFKFSCKNKCYVMRIPGNGSNQMINRENEYNVYKELEGKGICDVVLYISPHNGYKLTEYIDNARICDLNNQNDIKSCMKQLKIFHSYQLKVNHSFDIFEQIEHYEKLRSGTPSAFKDYYNTRKKIYELKGFIDSQPKEFALSHIDPINTNFLFSHDKIYLIDWEYAGMQDIHIDIAMFCLCTGHGKEKIDLYIDYYFDGHCDKNIRLKIYCYISVCGFLWSNWCEYKQLFGSEFGEYSLWQYRYAKDFYKIVKEELNTNES